MILRRLASILFVSVVSLALFQGAVAEDEAVVPDQEKSIAQELGVEGPTETHGIESSEILGSIGLGEDFEALQGRSLRARRVTVAAGGVVGVHADETAARHVQILAFAHAGAMVRGRASQARDSGWCNW